MVATALKKVLRPNQKILTPQTRQKNNCLDHTLRWCKLFGMVIFFFHGDQWLFLKSPLFGGSENALSNFTQEFFP